MIIYECLTGEIPQRGRLRQPRYPCLGMHLESSRAPCLLFSRPVTFFILHCRVPEEGPLAAVELMDACMQEDASRRPDAKSVVAMLMQMQS